MTDVLRDIVARNRAGEVVAIPSVCSAHPDVVRVALRRAERRDSVVVIEATSNQVNQDGGYTGLTAQGFVDWVMGLADNLGVDRARIVLGGDHLGPQAWRSLPAETAMEKAIVLVDSYVRAGFAKIHLDCSEGCAGEAAQLPDEVTAARSATLARVCEAVGRDILYVIGTEVPPPGGARTDEAGDIPATTPEAARGTLAAHEAAFGAAGLGIKDRVAGLVVQPGVEFSPMQVHHLPLDRDPGLRAVMLDWPALCLEAHSTDYQRPAVFPRLAELGFAFQKVGPALTHAYREALYALDFALMIAGRGTGLADTMEAVMMSDPGSWQGHYALGDRTARHVGLADRIRYYWPTDRAKGAVAKLMEAARNTPLPDPLLFQVFPTNVLDRAETMGGDRVRSLIDAKIDLALDPYDFSRETPA